MKRKNSEPYVRITQPLVRDAGALRPASWDEALDRAAAGFRRNINAGGPDAFACSPARARPNEMNYVAQKFARVVVGTNSIDSCNRT